jgi:preprotein translocase subunit SecA
MRLFGSERIKTMVEALGLQDDQVIEHRMLSNAIETAQKRVEGRNFDIRKHVIQFDDVMNLQRETIYSQRRMVLDGENLKEFVMNMIRSVVENYVESFTGEGKYYEEWDIEGLTLQLEGIFLPKGAFKISEDEKHGITKEDIKDKLIVIALEHYDEREEHIGLDQMRELERVVTLRVVDEKWMDHIDEMDQLRQGIGLRAYGQRDPVVEYKFEGSNMFEMMIASIQEDILKILFNAQIEKVPERQVVAEPVSVNFGDEGKQPKKRAEAKIGRNDLCPCGSGKKYKKCCGAQA